MFKGLKLFLLIFLLSFLITFLIVDGGTIFTIVFYNIRQGIKWGINELTRPPFTYQGNSLSFSPHLLIKKSTPLLSFSPTSSIATMSSYYTKITPPPEAEKENVLVLPKFNIIAPIKVVEKPKSWLIYEKLRQGVVLYPGSAIPGEGYSIIIGHSSQYPWKPGNYKRVFSLLAELKRGDKIYVFWNKKPLVFEVREKKIFLPWPKGPDITETVFPPNSQPTLILQSCWPVGVAYKRIAVRTVLIKY